MRLTTHYHHTRYEENGSEGKFSLRMPRRKSSVFKPPVLIQFQVTADSWVTGDDELGRHTRFRHALRERGERYVLGVPCTTTMRDLETPLPEPSGRGCRPKAPWQSVTQWR